NPDQTINEKLLQEIIKASPNIIITFHKAFDEVKDQFAAYKTLAQYDNVKYILTSGGKENCLEGKERLRELVKLSHDMDGPKIMPGGGLNLDNITNIHEFVQADYYHFGKAVRIDQSFANTFDSDRVKKIKNIFIE